MYWSSDKIAITPAKELLSLLENCYSTIEKNSSKSEDAKIIIAMIENSGRLKEGSSSPIGLSENDPKVKEMRAILEGDDAVALMIKAANENEPSLKYIDPVLQSELGEWYGNRYHSTAAAGGYIGEIMRDLGYIKKCIKKMPVNCKAKTASVFTKP